MAGKITELSAITAAQLSLLDVMEVVDVSDTSMAATGTNKKMSWSDLAISMGAQRVGCSLTHSGQSYASGESESVAWNGEVADPDGFHVANSIDVVVPSGLAGIYVISTTMYTGGVSVSGDCDVTIFVDVAVKPQYIPPTKQRITNTVMVPISAGTIIRVQIYNGHSAGITYSGSFDMYRISL